MGANLSARLISLAGSLEKLSIMPASTIQVLGAQKALFAHLTDGAPPPKHGIIFQHPFIRGNKKKNRGRVARALSGNIAIAARADFFGKHNLGKMLKEKFEKTVENGNKKN